MRLLLVTPLILTRLNESEIAAWYLFASLNFLGTVVTLRLGLTFTRMLAFAMGGSSNLAPIKGTRIQANNGKPNWDSFERAYGTIGSLSLGVACCNVLIALGMGWFGLSNLIEGGGEGAAIWIAFGCFQATSFVIFLFQRFGVALQGMNYVALTNRLGVLFALVSVVAGSTALAGGGGLIALTLAMQLPALLNLLGNRLLLGHVEGGRVGKLKGVAWDAMAIKWAWEPTWRGFIAQLGILGGVQAIAILYTGMGATAEVASYLFSLRMLQSIGQIAQAPFTSAQPRLARLLATGESKLFRSDLLLRAGSSLGLLILAVLGFGLLAPLLMEQIEAEVTLLDRWAWFTLSGLMVVQRFNILCTGLRAVGNELVFYWDMCAGAALGVLCILFIQNEWGVYGPILSSLVPTILILNVRPLLMVLQDLRLLQGSERTD